MKPILLLPERLSPPVTGLGFTYSPTLAEAITDRFDLFQ